MASEAHQGELYLGYIPTLDQVKLSFVAEEKEVWIFLDREMFERFKEVVDKVMGEIVLKRGVC